VYLKVVWGFIGMSLLVIAVLALLEAGPLRKVAGGILIWLAVVGLALWWADSHVNDNGREWSDLGRSLLVGGLVASAVWLVGYFQREDEQHHSLQLTLGQQQQLPGIDLHGEDLSEFNLARKNLSQADLSRTDLTKANLQKANLAGADLSDATLTEAKLESADLSAATMTGVHLEGAEADLVDLRAATLAEANLEDASLSGAQMEGACLADANLNGAFLPDAHLENAALTHADLRHTVFWYDLRPARLTSAGLDHARHAGTARWPPGYRYDDFVHPSRSGKPPASPVVPKGRARMAVVHSVFDGDTLTLTGIEPHSSKLMPVRLIGIDAPDLKEEGGLAAREFLEKRLTVGAKVMYLYDRRKEDAFERRLLYVFLRNGELVNQMLVQHGLAVELVDPPSNVNGNRFFTHQLSASEVWARQHSLGLWHSCPP
jgi:uncharacterized protein YjbI with pentapeptide repeats